MLNWIVHGQQLIELIRIIGRSRRMAGPVRDGDHHTYRIVERVEDIDLTFAYCRYSPKSLFFPPRETLFTFTKEDGQFHATPVYDATPTLLVGVHPCDVHGLHLLDHVFGSPPADEHYLSRRRNAFVIAVDCAAPCTANVFCHDLGTDHATTGFDLMVYPLHREAASGGATYGLVFGSDAGRDAILRAGIGAAPAAADERAMGHYLSRKKNAFKPRLPVRAEELPGLLSRSYDSLLWEATARRCYSCASCNLVCPTCYCFDIQDDANLTGNAGERFREWDGCQLRNFAEVAGGHNFRLQPAARLRHRVYRKGKWTQERTGLPGCVGCGRCERACTAQISLVEIYHQLAEEN
jgi:formate hydrogenlyase subunit 6/NADH:ubiquinone oxidoreductase subunit I